MFTHKSWFVKLNGWKCIKCSGYKLSWTAVIDIIILYLEFYKFYINILNKSECLFIIKLIKNKLLNQLINIIKQIKSF